MDTDILFGRIAIKNRMLTEILLDEVLQDYRSAEEQGKYKALAEIVLEKGFMNKKEVEAIAKLQSKYIQRDRDLLYGKIAIKNGLVTKDQVIDCLRLQKEGHKDRIGEILVDKGYISFQDHCAILRAQTRIKVG